MANKLIRIGYTQIIPANPGRPPTPPRTVTTTAPVTSGAPSPGSGGSPIPGAGGSWVLMQGDVGSMSYGSGKYVWVPNGAAVNTGVQPG